MSETTRKERETQNRVVAMFSAPASDGGLGYRYLGDLTKDPDNRCIRSGDLELYLERCGYSAAHIGRALDVLRKTVAVDNRSLPQINQDTWHLLRYGIQVQVRADQKHDTVELIDWDNPQNNDFAIAEEVTLRGAHERRPDIVLYINGLAVVVMELKRASVGVGDGVRQLVSNQQREFNPEFFSTVQLVLAGNDSEGLRYGTAGTTEKFFAAWRPPTEESSRNTPGANLDPALRQLLNHTTLLDLIQHCVLFDGGTKKVPRQHQYEGFLKARERIAQGQGGVIWHTQGSGKSILMVLIAKWVLQFDPGARVLVVTDRDELDKQIEGVMRNAGVIGSDDPSPRVTSRAELLEKLGATRPNLLCALIHKFDISDLEGDPPPVHGRFYVMVDECHRTQGGKMNRQMKRWLPNAVFLGFTGTPLLREDRPMTREVFGSNIHTYKFYQAVRDKVVLDLKYVARDVPQRIDSPAKIDEWFEEKTRLLSEAQKAILRKEWATLRELMSSKERKARIIADITHDFGTRPRLNSGRGTAILVAASIYDACHYYRLFQETELAKNCGLVTSFEPNASALSLEPAGSQEHYKYETYTNTLLKDGQTTKQYEDHVKRLFVEEPANMKLLIVVSKLLTGFDAPSCTYIYLDSELQDHTLFQAICRTNRLDGDDKDFGYIVDYKQLMGRVQDVLTVYNTDALDTEDLTGDEDASANNVEIKDWIAEGKRQLEEALEALDCLCAPVLPPRTLEQYEQYFCGDIHTPGELEAREPLRISFYQAVAGLMRAWATLVMDLDLTGYSRAEQERLKAQVVHYEELRKVIRNHAGEELDVREFEKDMRQLINTYILAGDSRELGALKELPLTALIAQEGLEAAMEQRLNPDGKRSQKSVAETIVNNVRKTIARDRMTDPRFYDRMSALLEDLLQQSRESSAAYEELLRELAELVKQIEEGSALPDMPESVRGSAGTQAIYNNLPTLGDGTFACPGDPEERAALTLRIVDAIRQNAPADWRGNPAREGKLGSALHPLLDRDFTATKELLELLKNQRDEF